MSAPAPLVELRGLSKSYGGVHALSEVGFMIERATVHALVGENGAGRSTLVKILTGVVHPDAGEIVVEGEPQRIGDPQTALRLGIVAMYQEPTVFPSHHGGFVGGDTPYAGKPDLWARPGADAGDLVFAYLDTQNSTLRNRPGGGFPQMTVLAGEGPTALETDAVAVSEGDTATQRLAPKRQCSRFWPSGVSA